MKLSYCEKWATVAPLPTQLPACLRMPRRKLAPRSGLDAKREPLRGGIARYLVEGSDQHLLHNAAREVPHGGRAPLRLLPPLGAFGRF